MDVRVVKLADLRPAAYNPRTITDESLAGLDASVGRFGMLEPIVWNERTGNIVGGHQRYRVLTEKGEEEAQVVVVDLSDDEEVALNIALNSPTMRGDFTKDVMGLLAQAEVQIGSAFNDLNLNALHNYVKRLKLDDGPKEPSSKKEKEEPKEEEAPAEIGASDAVITCPRCGSAWKMKDNKVIYNAAKKAQQD
jgi:hypothetical protein